MTKALLFAAICATAPIHAEEQQPAATQQPVVPAKPQAESTIVTPDEAEKLIAGTPGLIILDVRTPEEFEHEHIKGAVNINVLDPEFQSQIAALDQKKPMLIMDQAGRRSTRALIELAGKVQFPKIYHLMVGVTGWKQAKKALESQPLPGEGRLKPGKKR